MLYCLYTHTQTKKQRKEEWKCWLFTMLSDFYFIIYRTSSAPIVSNSLLSSGGKIWNCDGSKCGSLPVCILVYRFAPIPWNKITPRFNLVPFFYSFTYSPTPYQLLVLNTAMQTFSTP